MKPVFIIGGSRTGSELVKNILRKYSDIDFVPEMFLMSPRWLHRDFVTNAASLLNKKNMTYDVEGVLSLIYSKKLYGYFWTVVDELDRAELKNKILDNGSTLKGIFEAIMFLHAKKKNKNVPGAKFPVHYSSTDRLIEWFPESKIIHTTRDPRAIYVSQSNKYIRPEYSYLRNIWIRLQHFTHIIIQAIWTARVHKRLEGNERYYLFKYEEFLENPEHCMRELCAFLMIEYQSDMADPEIFSNSSFREKHGTGKRLQTSSAASWKLRINPYTELFIKIICRKAMKTFNYG